MARNVVVQRVVFLFMILGMAMGTPAALHAEESGFTPIPVIKGMELLTAGAKAPAFSVKDIEGKTFDFSQEMGKKAFMMVFWSIYCEPCREEMPLIEKIHNQYKGKDLEVLSINLDGDPFLDAVRGFVKQGRYTMRVLMDELQNENFKIADPYNVAGTPVIYLVNKKGEIAFNVLGRVEEKDLIEKIAKALSAP
jgi:thiol-disulfide isomerase/thioredoxin